MYRTQNVCFDFLYKLSETFIILRINIRDIIMSTQRLHVKCRLLLSNFNQTWIFRADFRKIHTYQISWKSAQWESNCSMRTDRRTRRS